MQFRHYIHQREEHSNQAPLCFTPQVLVGMKKKNAVLDKKIIFADRSLRREMHEMAEFVYVSTHAEAVDNME